MRILARGALTAALVVTACALGPAPAQASSSSPSLAYENSSGLYVWHAGHTSQLNRSGDAVGNFDWSTDGTLLTWTEFAKTTTTVRVADAAGRPLHTWSCTCDSGARFIGHMLYAVSGHHLVRMNPLTGSRTTVVLHGLPARRAGVPFQAPSAVAAVGGRLLIDVGDPAGTSAYGGPSDLYLVTTKGAARHLVADDGNVGVGHGVVSPDGREVAWVSEAHGGFCSDYEGVAILDVATGKLHRPAPPASKSALGITALNWSADGVLRAGVATQVGCASPGSTTASTTTATLYRVTTHSFTATGLRSAGYARSAAGAVASLGGRAAVDGIGAVSAGALTVTLHGTASRIAANVWSFAWSR